MPNEEANRDVEVKLPNLPALAELLNSAPKTTLDHVLDRLEKRAIQLADLKKCASKEKISKTYIDAIERRLDALTKEWEAAIQQVEQKNVEMDRLQKENAELRGDKTALLQLREAAKDVAQTDSAKARNRLRNMLAVLEAADA